MLTMLVKESEKRLREQKELCDKAIHKHKEIREEKDDVASLGHNESEWAYASMLS